MLLIKRDSLWLMPATHVQVGLSVLPAQLCLRQAAGACVGSGTPFS
jgi:hypothetical protein